MISYNTSIVTNGLSLYLDAANKRSYPGSGTSINDLCGVAAAGTLVNGPTFNSANNGSLVFDGTNDYGYINISTTTVNCAEIWVYFNADVTPDGNMVPTTGYQCASFSYQPSGGYSGGYDGFTLGSWTGDATNESIGYFHNGSYFRYIRDTVSAGWHQIGINWNSSSSAYEIFVDGVIKTTYSGASSYPSIPQFTTTKVTIGASTGTSGQYFFNGKIAIARLYNTSFTTSQLLQNFNAHRGRFGV